MRTINEGHLRTVYGGHLRTIYEGHLRTIDECHFRTIDESHLRTIEGILEILLSHVVYSKLRRVDVKLSYRRVNFNLYAHSAIAVYEILILEIVI